MAEPLVEFLLACIADDEANARASTPGPWRYSPNKHYRWPGLVNFEESVFAGQSGKAAASVARTGPSDDPQSMADAGHIAAWDPARVLAECEVKQRIVGLHMSVEDRSWLSGEPNNWHWCRTCGTTDDHPVAWPCETLRVLALPFADRTGYREEWKPSGDGDAS